MVCCVFSGAAAFLHSPAFFTAWRSGNRWTLIGYLLVFDPSDGFWFLNLGRNLVFTTEAYYHLIFLGCILLVLWRRFAWALTCAALLSASHPFYGLELLIVLGVWSIIEWVGKRPDRPPLYFPIALSVLTVLHVGYYLVLLNYLSEEHRVLKQQWSLPWLLPFSSMLAAYGIVAALAAIALIEHWRRTRSLSWTQRLFLIWFAVCLALGKHDLLITPVQPLHFTRGYIFGTPLFLIGAPILVRAIAAASRTAGIWIHRARRDRWTFSVRQRSLVRVGWHRGIPWLLRVDAQ